MHPIARIFHWIHVNSNVTIKCRIPIDGIYNRICRWDMPFTPGVATGSVIWRASWLVDGWIYQVQLSLLAEIDDGGAGGGRTS